MLFGVVGVVCLRITARRGRAEAVDSDRTDQCGSGSALLQCRARMNGLVVGVVVRRYIRRKGVPEIQANLLLSPARPNSHSTDMFACAQA